MQQMPLGTGTVIDLGGGWSAQTIGGALTAMEGLAGIPEKVAGQAAGGVVGGIVGHMIP
jgi:hypothetical protein